MKKTVVLLFLVLLFVFCEHCKAKTSHKRALPFIRGSAFGHLVAVAVPIDTISRNIFLAFNFEANYALPFNETHRDLLNQLDKDGVKDTLSNNVTLINFRKRSLFTRKHFYSSFVAFLTTFKMNGTGCLQRLICEVAQTNMGINNGLFGSLVHIIFSPSSSQEENISREFYDAESFGYENKCENFHFGCPESLLDLVSVYKSFYQ